MIRFHVVRNDVALMQYGQSLFNRHGHDSTKHEYIRQKLRELGRFLIKLREQTPSVTLEDAIKPSNFMNMVEAVKLTAGYNENSHSYKTPSLALKIGHSLLKVSEILQCNALIAENTDLAYSTETFQKLYRAKWSEYISHTALCTISDAKYNKKTKLAHTEDIMKLSHYILENVRTACKALSTDPCERNYSSLAKLALTQIILFNRRRVGEVSKIPMKNVLDRDDSYTRMDLGLSPFETKLCNVFTRVELKGKRGRKVAVLLTPEMKISLKLLIENRNQCGVLDQNEYLFALPRCLTFYQGHACLKKFAAECGAREPAYLKSTHLRKQVATTSQIMNLEDNELDQLADFFGHNIAVHRQYYRLPEATVQVAKIAKLLLALEKGKLPELQGKSLDEIGAML